MLRVPRFIILREVSFQRSFGRFDGYRDSIFDRRHEAHTDDREIHRPLLKQREYQTAMLNTVTVVIIARLIRLADRSIRSEYLIAYAVSAPYLAFQGNAETMPTNERVDIHHHYIPPFWAEQLDAHGGDPSGSAMPQWSADASLAFMDDFGITTSILSLTTPGINGWHGEHLNCIAKKVNDFGADLRARRPDRFGFLAVLPVPDVGHCIAEATRAFDELGADGVVLMSNVNGMYPAEEPMEALWAELDRRSAVVFIHPSMPMMSAAKGVAGPLVDFPADTTRAAVQLVLTGIMDRHRKVRVVLAHAGGFVPYAAPRFAELATAFDANAIGSDDDLDAFKRFHFDTAISGYHPTIDALVEFASHGKILFGSDFPYVKPEVAKKFIEELESADLGAAAASGIAYGNAQALFPRLKRLRC